MPDSPPSRAIGVGALRFHAYPADDAGRRRPFHRRGRLARVANYAGYLAGALSAIRLPLSPVAAIRSGLLIISLTRSPWPAPRTTAVTGSSCARSRAWRARGARLRLDMGPGKRAHGRRGIRGRRRSAHGDRGWCLSRADDHAGVFVRGVDNAGRGVHGRNGPALGVFDPGAQQQAGLLMRVRVSSSRRWVLILCYACSASATSFPRPFFPRWPRKS